jgi:hypothetical protein
MSEIDYAPYESYRLLSFICGNPGFLKLEVGQYGGWKATQAYECIMLGGGKRNGHVKSPALNHINCIVQECNSRD